jgi:(p)ppGpp synthase/HD superfamily hydrolase
MNKIEEAILFATKAHEGQRRKLVNIPYILHPLEVCSIITNITPDEDTIIAGLLHDTVEDCDVDPREIKEKFGKRVAALVQCETEDKYSHLDPKETWQRRKEESLTILKITNDIGVKILWLADKLANLRSFYRSWLKQGDDIWLQLNQKDKKKHEWYYRSVLSNMTELSHLPEYQEALDLVNKMFKE